MSTTLATSSGTITLPDDIPWVDEYKWSPISQAISTTLGGALIVEVGAQSFGRPITLGGNRNTAWVDGDTMDALRAAEIAQLDTPFTLTLVDGRTFTVLFFGSLDAPAVFGEEIDPITPRDSGERSTKRFYPVIKLIQVG